MNEKNIYKNSPPDFTLLSSKFPSFKKYVFTNRHGAPTINWRDPHAVRELTYVLLEHDFQLKVELPIDQLCPTIPLRANYIHWISDLLELSTFNTPITGLDIGIGASCIYPLLGARLYGWNFIGTDKDAQSIEYAQKNIEFNKFEDKITLVHTTPSSPLVFIPSSHETLAFTMSNPPFFSTADDQIEAERDEDRPEGEEEGEEEKKDKEKEEFDQTHVHKPNPRTVCTATKGELATPGGEVAFIKRMIDDSLQLREKIRWYTSMVGRKADLKEVKNLLYENKITNVRTTEFFQGRTTRWAVAWSFSQDGYSQILAEANLKSKKKQKKEEWTREKLLQITGEMQPSLLVQRLSMLFQLIPLSYHVTPQDPLSLYLSLSLPQSRSLSASPSLLASKIISQNDDEEEDEDDDDDEDDEDEDEDVGMAVVKSLQQLQDVEELLAGNIEDETQRQQLLSMKEQIESTLKTAYSKMDEKNSDDDSDDEDVKEDEPINEDDDVIGPALPSSTSHDRSEEKKDKEKMDEVENQADIGPAFPQALPQPPTQAKPAEKTKPDNKKEKEKLIQRDEDEEDEEQLEVEVKVLKGSANNLLICRITALSLPPSFNPKPYQQLFNSLVDLIREVFAVIYPNNPPRTSLLTKRL